MNLKKVLAGVLAAASVVSLAGCNNGSTSGTTSSGNSSSGTSTTSGDSTSTTSGDSASSGDTSDTTSGSAGAGPLEGGIQFDASKITPGMTLTVYTNRTDRDTDGSLKEMVKPFEERYGCTVEFLAYTDYDTIVKANIRGGDYGDVLNLPTGLRTSDYPKYFEPLGTISDLSKVYQWTDQKAYEGEVYALATGGNASGVCYNKRVWTEAGITEVPRTEEDFIADLKKIREVNGEAVDPAALCFFAGSTGWILKEYTQFAPAVSGDPEFKLHSLVNKVDIFGSKDNQTPYYKVCKWMYDMYKDPDLHEIGAAMNWETSKQMLADGKVATIIVSSWGVSQFKALAANPDDIGFMPLPFTDSEGKQYAETGPDTSMCVSSNISDEQKALAKAYVKWWIEESTWAKDEGFVPTLIGGELPDSLAEFNGVNFFSQTPLPDEISKCWDNINKKSKVGIDNDATDDNYKTKIAQAGLDYEKTQNDDAFEQIMADCNKAWAEARDADEDLAAYMAAQGL